MVTLVTQVTYPSIGSIVAKPKSVKEAIWRQFDALLAGGRMIADKLLPNVLEEYRLDLPNAAGIYGDALTDKHDLISRFWKKLLERSRSSLLVT